jgi:uncharacterized protein (TIRG00374 family)
MTEPERARKSKRSFFTQRTVISAVAVVALLYVTIVFYGDVSELRPLVLGFNWWYLPGALAARCGAQILRFARWHFYIVTFKIPLTFTESLLIFFAGLTMSITPGKFGELIKSFLIRERIGVAIAATAPIVLAERLTDLIAMVVLGALLSLIFKMGVLVAVAGGAIALVLLFASVSKSFAGLVVRLIERIPFAARFAPGLRTTFDNLRLSSRPGVLVVATLLPLMAFWLNGVVVQMVLNGLANIKLDLARATFAYTIPALAGGLSMLPAGLGATELGMSVVLKFLLPAIETTSVAVAAALLVRLCTLWWDELVGVFAFLILRYSGRAKSVAGR